MIKAEKISVIRGEKPLVSDADLTLKGGELSVIVGPNGAGKSTLLKVLTGDLSADAGTIEFEGQALNKISLEDLAKRRAVLAQTTSLTFDFCVEEVVMLGRIPHLNGWETEDDRRATQEAIAAVEMEAFANRRYTSLSGGEAQRVHLARVLAQLDLTISETEASSARWIFLDEPTSALDLRHQHKALSLVKKLTRERGLGAVAVLHDLNLTMHYADHVILMSQGKIEASGPSEDTLTSQRIADVYGVEVETYQASSSTRPFIHVIEARNDRDH